MLHVLGNGWRLFQSTRLREARLHLLNWLISKAEWRLNCEPIKTFATKIVIETSINTKYL